LYTLLKNFFISSSSLNNAQLDKPNILLHHPLLLIVISGVFFVMPKDFAENKKKGIVNYP
jgi:hypothetical protein